MSAEGRKPILVAVADDSPSALELLCHVLESGPGLRVSARARDGREIVEILERQRPDVVVMDVLMPRMDGLAATRAIMRTRPCPILLVSGLLDPKEAQTVFRAMEAGALAILAKPHGPSHPGHEASAEEFRRTVKAMSQVNVVRRTAAQEGGAAAPAASAAVPGSAPVASPAIVAVGASTGGPQVLKVLLAGLGTDFPLPVLIAQHMAPGFCAGFAEWLLQATGFPISIAQDPVRPAAGRAYVAPDRHHLEVDGEGLLRIRPFAEDRAENGPSVGRLFRSVELCYGAHGIGVLLTGMGTDGAEELGAMRRAGAPTMVQDEASSVVYGMPGQAVRLGAAVHVLPPAEIARLLRSLAAGKGGTR